jgi:outer membrane protein assembly factor BamA
VPGNILSIRTLYLAPYKLDVSLRYDYQFLNARSSDSGVVEEVGVGDAKAAAFILELKHDRLDNALSPRRGYKLFANIEFASDALGGDVSYQRLQLGGSSHWDLGGGRVVHVGAAHGVTFTWLGTPRELPFNRRFFPGGENLIRGFQYGEAAPRDASGRLVGRRNFPAGQCRVRAIFNPNPIPCLWMPLGWPNSAGIIRSVNGSMPWAAGCGGTP